MNDGAVTVRCLTPPGSAAIAVLELRGGGAWNVVRELFRPRSGELFPESPPPGLLVPGAIGPPPGDEVVLAVRFAGREPVIEVHCHGGNEVVRWLIDTFRSATSVAVSSVAGLSEAGPRVQRTRGPGSVTPATEEAYRLLAHAPSLRTASILLDQYHGAFDQYHGAFDRALNAIDRQLADGRPDNAARLVTELLRFAALGAHLVNPWRVVLAGAPNVGKSSLLNALAGYQRCVVTPIPGTTRDVVTARLVFDGWPVEIADTAGQRLAADALEAAGVARSAAAQCDADLCVWVVETGAEPVWPPEEATATLIAINKIDQPCVWTQPRPDATVRVSALTGEGIEQLIRAIVDRLVPVPPTPGVAVPITADQLAGLRALERAIAAGELDQARAVIAAMRSADVS